MGNLKLIKMTDIETQEVQWLWHPYIPFGKITIIQGETGAKLLILDPLQAYLGADVDMHRQMKYGLSFTLWGLWQSVQAVPSSLSVT